MKWIVAGLIGWVGITGFLQAENSDLYTNVYVVPPTFLNVDVGSGNGASDPFAPPAAGGEALTKRPTAKDVLEQAGITFGPGSSAIYNSSNSQIIVRNTLDQMELVETYIESIVHQVEKQIYITFREAVFEGNPFVQKNGEDSTVRQPDLSDVFSGLLEIPANSSNKAGEKTQTFDSTDELIEELRRPPVIPKGDPNPFEKGVSGVLTDPQFQVLFRALKDSPDVEVSTAPSIMCRSGRPGLSQKNETRYGIDPVVGADEFTVNLQIFLPSPGKPLEGEDKEMSTFNVTIWDGQIVVLVEKPKQGKTRLVFVKAQIVDPAGLPINPKGGEQEKVEEGAKEEAKNDSPSEHADFGPVEQKRTKQADEFALRASQLMAAGETKEAFEHYVKALGLLPQHDMTQPRRDAYMKQAERAGDLLEQAEIRAAAPAASDSSHIVKQGETLYQIASQYSATVSEVKNRNRLESDVVEVGQLLLLPDKPMRGELFPKHDLESALKRLTLRQVDLQDTPFLEALALFQQELLNHEEPNLPEIKPRLIVRDAERIGDTKITLRLSNVPAIEALRYLTALAQCRYELVGNQIVISPLPK